jgi:hypothetical protein
LRLRELLAQPARDAVIDVREGALAEEDDGAGKGIMSYEL